MSDFGFAVSAFFGFGASSCFLAGAGVSFSFFYALGASGKQFG